MHLFKKAQDPMSSYTHFIGAVLGFVYTLILQGLAFWRQSSLTTHLTTLIFTLSILALYSASSYYHYVSNDNIKKQFYRKLDHAMIYVLIAGTYTPVSMYYLEKPTSFIFTSIIWAIAFAGIIAKVIWLNAPRILYTLLYLAMGWAIVFYWKGFSAVPLNCLLLITMGGLSYTIGAIIYMLKKPNINVDWGFHELFHIFILLGTAFHFIAVTIYII